MKALVKDELQLLALMHDIAKTGDFPLEISAKKASRRTIPMNSTLHMWFGELSKFLVSKGRKDCTPEFCKDLMKFTFLGCEEVERINAVTGERVKMQKLRSTTDLDKGEYLYFMEQVNQWCADKGCLLTMPIKSEYRELIERQNR